MTELNNLLDVIVETSGATLPGGFTDWGIKSVHPDLRTTNGFTWALPGGINVSNDKLDRSNTGACPDMEGDGLCVATTWRGMASGGITARTILLVAYRTADVVGRDELDGKLRIGAEVASVALIDGDRLLREHGRNANLWGADLQGADLQGANLWGANLQGANLWGANLHGADLRGANLQGANLWGANLWGANLQGANLQGANLWGAYLQGADLQGADLRGADLRGANLWGANLQGAYLQGAYLQGANLQGANLQGADLRGARLPIGWCLTETGQLARDEVAR